jgi:hypothetical protein
MKPRERIAMRERVMGLAGRGYSRKMIAAELGITMDALVYLCRGHTIKFRRLAKATRAEEFSEEAAAYTDKMREVYKQELANEIAAAKREAPYAPPYKPPLFE